MPKSPRPSSRTAKNWVEEREKGIFGLPLDSDANCVFGFGTPLDRSFFTKSNVRNVYLGLGTVMAILLETV